MSSNYFFNNHTVRIFALLQFIINVENSVAYSLRVCFYRSLLRAVFLQDIMYNAMLIYRGAIVYAFVTNENTKCFYGVF